MQLYGRMVCTIGTTSKPSLARDKATLPPPLLSLSVLKIVDVDFNVNNGYVRLLLTKHCNQNLSQAKNWYFSVIIK